MSNPDELMNGYYSRRTESGNKVLLLSGIVVLVIAISLLKFYIPKPESAAVSVDAEEGLQTYSGIPNTVEMKLPAININDTGVSARLTVGIKKGTGNIYFTINNALSNPDTQQSARAAALYAAGHEGVSLNSIDATYDIRAAASLIEGPSAGAAFAIAMIAALRNEALNPDVMITGTINHDGTIGPSGKILEKAKVAKRQGAKVFLAPVGSVSGLEVNYTETEFCRNWGGFEYCQPEFTPKIINVSEEAGIPIVEVATVEEALPYFIKD